MTFWNKIKLGEIATITSSKRIFANEYQTEGIPFYRGKEIIEKHNGNNVSTELYISRQKYEEIKSKFDVPKTGDILLSSVGTLGVPWLVDEEEFYFKDGNLTWLRCNEKVTCEFLYLWLNSPEAKNQINAMCIGSTQKALTIETLKKFVVTLPTLKIQKNIVNVINPIEKKIRVNAEINRNLSEQLDSLYSELSTCQKWEYVAIDELADKIAMGPFGSNIKVSTFVERGIPIISGNHLRGHFLEEPSYNYITEEHAEKLKNSNVYPKDVIFTHAGNIGQVAMIPDDSEYDRYVISQRQFYLRCNLEKVLPEYVTLFFHSNEGQQELLSYANQVGVPSIAQPVKNLKKIQIPLPPIDVQREWLTIVKPMISLHQKTSKENKRLVLLRDSLLPKLMSGRLDVSELDI